jgi:hypothetical protein
VCYIDASLVVDAQGNCPYVLNLIPVNDLTLWLIVDTEGDGAKRDLACPAESLKLSESPGGDV